MYFDTLTSLTFSYSVFAVEQGARESGKKYLTDFSSFEILLSMSFGVNYNLSPNGLTSSYLESNRKDVEKIINEFDKIEPFDGQRESRSTMNLYLVLREILPNFYEIMGSDRDWYLEPFWNPEKTESFLLLGLTRGLVNFQKQLAVSYEFYHNDVVRKNTEKMLVLFFWFVDEYYREFKGLSRDKLDILITDGVNLIKKYDELRRNNFSNSKEIDKLVQDFTAIRFMAFYSTTQYL